MSINQDFLDRVRHDIARVKEYATPPASIRMNKEQAKLIEAEYAVQHGPSGMTISGVRIVVDDDVPFGQYELD